MNALSVAKDAIQSNHMTSSATLIIFSDVNFHPRSEKMDALFKGLIITSIVVGVGSLRGPFLVEMRQDDCIL